MPVPTGYPGYADPSLPSHVARQGLEGGKCFAELHKDDARAFGSHRTRTGPAALTVRPHHARSITQMSLS